MHLFGPTPTTGSRAPARTTAKHEPKITKHRPRVAPGHLGPLRWDFPAFNAPITPQLAAFAVGLQPPYDHRYRGDNTQESRLQPGRHPQQSSLLFSFLKPRSDPFGDLHVAVCNIDERLRDLEAALERRLNYLVRSPE